MNAHSAAPLETATLGGGCFWCLEAVFQELKGIASVRSGYAGGHTANPSYRQICTGKSGHAEVVELRFDPSAIGYEDVLDIFFAIHDPTTLNRQGNDVGDQYRSVIFTHSDSQHASARAKVETLNASGAWRDPIVTQVLPAPVFWVAEDYHQNYFRDNPEQGYCQFVVAPKVLKFREKFAALRRG